MSARSAMLTALQVSGITRRELARRMKVSAPFITKVLSADHNITLSTLIGVVDACGFELVIHVTPKRGK